jgi:phospholipase/carboxylesterase
MPLALLTKGTDEEEPPMTDTLPRRHGPAPELTGPVPQGQTCQIAPIMLQEELWARMRALPYTYLADSLVSVTHARALFLADGIGDGPAGAFQDGREFAHLHPHHDGSLHLALPETVKDQVEESGWGVRHPTQPTEILIYGPRDRDELDTVFNLVEASYRYALGTAA